MFRISYLSNITLIPYCYLFIPFRYEALLICYLFLFHHWEPLQHSQLLFLHPETIKELGGEKKTDWVNKKKHRKSKVIHIKCSAAL